MNFLGRHLVFPCEALIYGPVYATFKYLIRSPKPLDPEKTWKLLTGEPSGLVRAICEGYPPKFVRRLLLGRHRTQAHEVGISEHYDVSNDFYELFLDKKYMFYTCADHYADTQTLEEAQTNKANFILGLVDPKPGEKILELGCGWGSMMKRIYEHTGDKENLHGYTLSKEQVAYNTEHNGFNVEFKNFVTSDYPTAEFDKIYSIGAWEAVRPDEHLQLMEKLYRALKPGGRCVLHFFCFSTHRRPASSICGLIFFPGHLLSEYRFYLNHFEQVGFQVTQRTIHDYRQTLRDWFDNLVANKEQAIDLVGVETYNRYIVFFPASWRYFEDDNGLLIRWVLDKPPA